MKILIVNYRYFVSGGPERYLFNVKQLLESHGHEVIPFSVQSRLNQPSEYEADFLSPVGSGNEVYFNEYNKKNLKTMGKTLSRMFYSFEARRKLKALIGKTKPDLVYVLHYQNKISASIFDAAKKAGVPVVYRASDYGQICANGIFYRYNKKEICERCLTGSRFNAVTNKCVHNSRILSLVKMASLQLQDLLRVSRKINAYVIPSGFTKTKFEAYGIPAAKLFYIPTFFNFRTVNRELPVTYEPFALYVGRLEEEKGLLTLVKAFADTDMALKIIGSSGSGYEKVLHDYLAGRTHRIEFLGKMDFSAIQAYLATCAFTVMPAECYDNFPNTILESYAFSKAVIASNNGSLKEIVNDRQTGLLFGGKDVQALRQLSLSLMADPASCKRLGDNAYHKLTTEYSEEAHYNRLLSVFESVLANHKNKAA